VGDKIGFKVLAKDILSKCPPKNIFLLKSMFWKEPRVIKSIRLSKFTTHYIDRIKQRETNGYQITIEDLDKIRKDYGKGKAQQRTDDLYSKISQFQK